MLNIKSCMLVNVRYVGYNQKLIYLNGDLSTYQAWHRTEKAECVN